MLPHIPQILIRYKGSSFRGRKSFLLPDGVCSLPFTSSCFLFTGFAVKVHTFFSVTVSLFEVSKNELTNIAQEMGNEETFSFEKVYNNVVFVVLIVH